MFIIEFILWVDGIITVGFIISKDFNRVSFDIITEPSSWAINDVFWAFTIESGHTFWTLFFSDLVFSFFITFIEFTEINRRVIIEITIS
jgi:hypothetical protein